MTLLSQEIRVDWAGEELLAQPEKVLWWPRVSALLVADMHLGKIGHFRKAGIPLPMSSAQAAMDKLDQVVRRLKPERLLVLGDLTHSAWNKELQVFQAWRASHEQLVVELVRGNHDIIADQLLKDFKMQDLGVVHREGGLELTHDPEENILLEEGYCRLAGHVRPGVRLTGKARQSMRLPCFYFGQKLGLLPAFGAFTGKARINPANGDRVIVIAGDRLVDMEVGDDEPAVDC